LFKKNELLDTSFVIAEVGQNHQGDEELAMKYVTEFASAGADAVKFQTRNNRYLFDEESYNKSYDSENAFADNYGAHREALELEVSFLSALKKECLNNGVKFLSTPFDEPSLETLVDVGVDAIKIASFDIGNLPFISRIAETKLPVVMSIGGAQMEHVQNSVSTILEHHHDVAILHCVSEYPCSHDRLGLENIRLLAEEFGGLTIGLSDHFNGILSGPIAYTEGARVFEKHVTLNRAWKGTDHSFALERHGFTNFCRDIRRVPEMFNSKPKDELGTEAVFKKLGKSITAFSDLNVGDQLTLANLSGRIFQQEYVPVRESHTVIGKKLKNTIKKGMPIKLEDIE